MSPLPDETMAELVALSRRLGDPAADLVILAEGNTSMRTGDDTLLVKASGARLATASAADFVEVRIGALLELLDGEGDDASVATGFAKALVAGTRRPSVEAILHAVCQSETGATVVAHTHPVAVNAVLCSTAAPLLADVALFPDQVVVLGTAPLYVEYLDPGVPLAREVRARIRRHVAVHGVPPRVVYLANHGMFALGGTPAEVEQVTAMAVKTARILAGALACGGAVPLPAEHVRRIDTRPDEVLRRGLLAAADRQEP